jgi:hypothetical protein
VLRADVRFVGFDHARQLRKHIAIGHRVTQAVIHKPRGAIRHAEHAVKLMRRQPLLAGADQVQGKQPL